MADTRLDDNFDTVLVVHKERNIDFIRGIRRIFRNGVVFRYVNDLTYFGDISEDERFDVSLEYSYSQLVVHIVNGMSFTFSYGNNPNIPEKGNLWYVSGNISNQYEPDTNMLSEVELDDVVKYFRKTMFFDFNSFTADKSNEPAFEFNDLMEYVNRIEKLLESNEYLNTRDRQLYTAYETGDEDYINAIEEQLLESDE